MPTILIDAGNSRIKVSFFDNAARSADSGQVHAFAAADLNRLADLVRQLPQPPTRALGVSVTTEAIRQELDAIVAPCAIEWQTPGARLLRLKNRYHNPAELGPDRWLGMLGVLTARPVDGPKMLVSFGTATTVDTIDDHETFLGGVIFPGVSMMQSSLGAGTARLPIAPMPAQAWPAFPQSTQAAIATGIVAAQTGGVIRQWQQVTEHLGRAPLMFVTGGARAAILPELQAQIDSFSVDMGFGTIPLIECESPVLDGLRALAQHSPDA
ncbi:hypothetical protein CAP48_05500 [Advenella sp. S44]|uniref:type III pantothenate kinase n=1 Tax=Advenella sp. S44 TaxID=1982755 RepID=UPI000C2AF710|nr:type III pantothenate kinase [Advenella sp. S44]PJX25502.1 hypothetical protein CAP48_05500 [Advenella sp. S44]